MKLSEYRKRKGLTQAQLAHELGLGPNSITWISAIENGRRPASIPLALKIEIWSGGKVKAAEVSQVIADMGIVRARKAPNKEAV